MSTLRHKNTPENASEPAMDDAGAAGQAICPQAIDGTTCWREPFAQILDALTGWHRCPLLLEVREVDDTVTDSLVSDRRSRHEPQPL